jgi:hypothetical protein
MSVLDEQAAKRIAILFRKLGSDFEGEQLNTLAAMRNLFKSKGLSFNDIGTVIENANGEIEQFKYSDKDAELIFARGVEEGRKQNAGHAGPALSAQYFDADGEPRWAEMVKFCERSPAKTSLKPNEQEFIDEMPAKLRWRAPTRPMGGFLLSIFWKLGGSFK